MDKPFISNFLYLKEIPEINGYGVFTNQDIPVDTLIEVSPVILYPLSIMNMAIYFARGEGYKDSELMIDQYAITWVDKDKPNERAGLMLGYCSVYNHSNNNNARFTTDYETNLMGVVTIKPVKKNEQVTVSYGLHWFEQKSSYITPVEF
jgi:hypothetical protein